VALSTSTLQEQILKLVVTYLLADNSAKALEDCFSLNIVSVHFPSMYLLFKNAHMPSSFLEMGIF
jgi:hypothetical protein